MSLQHQRHARDTSAVPSRAVYRAGSWRRRCVKANPWLSGSRLRVPAMAGAACRARDSRVVASILASTPVIISMEQNKKSGAALVFGRCNEKSASLSQTVGSVGPRVKLWEKVDGSGEFFRGKQAREPGKVLPCANKLKRASVKLSAQARFHQRTPMLQHFRPKAGDKTPGETPSGAISVQHD